jgi:ribose 5-phosphate isomerase B
VHGTPATEAEARERGNVGTERPSTRPDEDEIRALVARMVAGVVGASPSPLGGGTGVTPASAPDRSIAMGADHGGYVLKERLAEWLRSKGWDVRDCGTRSADPVDYPDVAHAVAMLVAARVCANGIVIDGAGIGSCMVANKVPGVRAALCYDLSSARNSREHNHANVLALGARLIGEGLAQEIVETWLTTPWGEGRHAARVAKIADVERRYVKGAG